MKLRAAVGANLPPLNDSSITTGPNRHEVKLSLVIRRGLLIVSASIYIPYCVYPSPREMPPRNTSDMPKRRRKGEYISFLFQYYHYH